jgi:heme exporter protein D
MQWHSLSEFAAMGGYGVYVWGSVGACALGMLVEPWLIRRRHRRLVRGLRRPLHAARLAAFTVVTRRRAA